MNVREYLEMLKRDTATEEFRRQFIGEWRVPTFEAAPHPSSIEADRLAIREAQTVLDAARVPAEMLGSSPQARFYGGLDFGTGDESVLALYEGGLYTTNVSNAPRIPITVASIRAAVERIRDLQPPPAPTLFPPHVVGYFDIGDDVSIKDRTSNTIYMSVGEALKREFAGEDVEIVLHKCVHIEMAVAGCRTAINRKRKTDRNPDGWLRPLPPPDPLEELRRYFDAPDAKIKTVPHDVPFVSGVIYPRVPWGSDKGDRTTFPYQTWERQLRPVSLGDGRVVYAAISPDLKTIYVREEK